jgi:crotonobetainyl-CoA:carnitine CoA-transferase CaiB-like acyl-CoA transferase
VPGEKDPGPGDDESGGPTPKLTPGAPGVGLPQQPRTGPLAGTRIIELGSVLMLPYAGQQLAALGAEVIMVEAVGGDMSRSLGPATHSQLSGIALNLHSNKRSLAVDLKATSGRDVLLRVLSAADAMITSMRPRALKRLGLDFDTLGAMFPALVYCQASGFRSASGDADRPAFDDIVQALSGIAALGAEVDDEVRFLPTVIADKVCGLTIAASVLAALLARHQTGRGQRVEVPMVDTMVAFNLAEHLAGGAVPGGRAGYSRVLTRHRGPHRTSDGWIALLPYSDEHWRLLYGAIGCEEKLAQPWHQDRATRHANAARVYGELAELIRRRPTAFWLELAERLDIPASTVPSLQELVEDPERNRGVLVQLEHPQVGAYRHIAQTTSFSDTPAVDQFPAPLVGQDGLEVLGTAGYTQTEIEELIRNRVVVIERQ